MQANTHCLQLTQINIKQFRCFKDFTLDFDNRIVLIQGSNGSGKTSILEALHYLCYLRSFRTHSPRDLIQFGNEGFFIKASFNAPIADQLMPSDAQVGFAHKKRLVKVNQKPVATYKELMDYYRIVTLTEDDLHLISSGPEIRRAFIDQALLLDDPEFMGVIKNYKTILDNRNALFIRAKPDLDSYHVWTDQLWNASRIIQERRIAMLAQFEQETNHILTTHFDNQLSVSFSYAPKKIGPEVTEAEFNVLRPSLYQEESRFSRSLFGAHLDDFIIRFQDKKSKSFASRGQQKLIVLLLKMAQLKHIGLKRGSAIFLLDDFMTDFDPKRAAILIDSLDKMGFQLIFTSPMEQGVFEDNLRARGAQQVQLTY
jgi:DNA replication and repair protein RecF